MDSRRDFIKKASWLSGGLAIMNTLPPSIQQALAINPEIGTTYLDAEHIVILMQENRSFDHCYGSLKGVRGFDDPRAVQLPNGNPVWLQAGKDQATYAPFRLDIKETKSTFIGSLPHSWPDQVDARNDGKFDQWILSKGSGHRDFKNAPLTLGYYNREDLPFYYSLADAFTICDQNFCSSLTGTTPNRLYLWTGTIRPEQKGEAPAHVMNSDTDYHKEVNWKTFPERLEENGISWRVYQNEISIESGLNGPEDSWLANFTDNPLEWFSQYGVRYAEVYQRYMAKMEAELPAEIAHLAKQLAEGGDKEAIRKIQRELVSKKNLLDRARKREQWSAANFARLSEAEKNLFLKAFTTNKDDADYRKLSTLKYNDAGVEREMTVPAGDSLYQFRKDVEEGKLPTVSWLIGSENFSDHPGAPWYGAWYVSEVLNILTSKPETWKKTIFILCYDENDGYFDHVPPFVAPHPLKSDTGKVSKGIDTSVEYVLLENDLKMRGKENARESPIGLGYRVPLVVASPWSRGGAVCSQVFDHTSILQFLEKFLTHKTGKEIKETNISSWRRTVCGDLTAVFKPYRGEKYALPKFLHQQEVYESIHKAQFKKDPAGYSMLNDAQIESIKKGAKQGLLPRQEKGTKPSCPLPYELEVSAVVSPAKDKLEIELIARKDRFGTKLAGAPFIAYLYQNKETAIRNYAVSAGDRLKDDWELRDKIEHYTARFYGPNGFYREFKGTKDDPRISVQVVYSPAGDLILQFKNNTGRSIKVMVEDLSYNTVPLNQVINTGLSGIEFDLTKSFHWYDLRISFKEFKSFSRRLAGRVETGKMGRTDPVIGRE